MKKIGTNRPPRDSYGARDAAASLDVSVPTVKRMLDDGTLEGFRTPGGHVRISAESIEAARDQRQTRPRPVQEETPMLQNRRERLEEFNLEAQEMRVRREIERMRREDEEEIARQDAAAERLREEAEQRHADFEREHERQEREKTQERRRQERERMERQARAEAEQELAAFHQKWYAKAAETVDARKPYWATPTQRKELIDGLEDEIERREPSDEPRMAAIIGRTFEALVEPLKRAHDAQERRQTATNDVMGRFPHGATDAEKAKATAAIREALSRLDESADSTEMRVAAQEAVQPLRQVIERRQLDARMLSWATTQLPWGRTDRDVARIQRECAEVLERLPVSITEANAKEALEPKVSQARREIEKRQADEQSHARRASLIQQGLAEVSTYLMELKREGEIEDEDFYDPEFTADVRAAVQRGLEAQLSGDESSTQIRKLTREIIDGELE